MVDKDCDVCHADVRKLVVSAGQPLRSSGAVHGSTTRFGDVEAHRLVCIMDLWLLTFLGWHQSEVDFPVLGEPNQGPRSIDSRQSR